MESSPLSLSYSHGHDMTGTEPASKLTAIELEYVEPTGHITNGPELLDDDQSDWENDDIDDDDIDGGGKNCGGGGGGGNGVGKKGKMMDKKKDFIVGRIISTTVDSFQRGVKKAVGLMTRLSRGHFKTIVCLSLYFIYFVTALCYRSSDEGARRLIGATVVGVLIYARSFIKTGIVWLCQRVYGSDKLSPGMNDKIDKSRPIIRWILYIVLAVVCVYIVIDEGLENPKNLKSLPGLLCFVLVCLLVSSKPSKINWHTIYWSLCLQFFMAFYALRWQTGKDSIAWLQRRLDEFFAHAKAGSTLLFGPGYEEHYLIFGAIPVFIYISGAITVLYYLGIMQFVVLGIGKILGYVLGTSPVESMSVAAGIFLESVAALSSLVPYMHNVTRSQLFLIMTSTFASIGGTYLAMLSRLQVPLDYLIAAMVISAPATFCVCKLMVPETQRVAVIQDGGIDVGNDEKKKYGNVLDAAQSGANFILPMLASIVANCFCIWSFISWINATLTWFGDRVGIDGLTIEEISSYLLYPASLAMGVETEDCRNVAMLLGYRISSTSLLSFIKMAELKGNRYKYNQYMAATNFTGHVIKDGSDVILDQWNETLKDGFISERSEAIATYSLAGFSSFVSAGLCLGMLCIILPKRKSWMAKKMFLALIAGNIANCMTGCFASLFY